MVYLLPTYMYLHLQGCTKNLKTVYAKQTVGVSRVGCLKDILVRTMSKSMSHMFKRRNTSCNCYCCTRNASIHLLYPYKRLNILLIYDLELDLFNCKLFTS